MRYEITTIRLDATKNKHHPHNTQSLASVESLLKHGWELVATVRLGDDRVVFLRHRRIFWRFWKRAEPLPGKRSFPVYRH